ncbi:hypothetical protein [Methylobacterium aerolatum]|uniref:Uncharacterized protein n=1 Tax=Methylobacterium aerolatum TaxID=418708 RepID=A0ABU0HXE9_9HYPH|nr:hypothetical protein [Methylobacterium aerolatum]MDQ0446986.1 hypothetical protein [Methylobacterium aerolatum]GJD36775.1 hypothetical protein FMGBMHLM_3698 [Methylobacterium aerolatum]
MNDPASRRGFLRGLTTLPLIGGGISLIGAPSAVAQPVTTGLLMAYDEWLFMERRMLCLEQCPGDDTRENFRPTNTGAHTYHFDGPGHWRDPHRLPSTRAALVLSAVGCEWEGRGIW